MVADALDVVVAAAADGSAVAFATVLSAEPE